ncbi:MAG: 16S rRNA (guanine(966)-N(2))-methyltransferase RsmD [Clostridia bacterium]|nr:16S rRNA (guanine(966)-N(2))-methyltransferase RsmD [Clostridia bacterium]
MRIISGKYRGLKLADFDGNDVRPTADRVKESLFNVLYGQVVGATVLDLFCGSGNLGIECLSRGAECVHFNDISTASLEILKKNLARLKNPQQFKITNYDYFVCLSRADKYDLIFIDPPYRLEIGVDALKLIGAGNLLKAGGLVVFERDRSFEGEIAGLKKIDERKYGKTYLTFFEKEA